MKKRIKTLSLICFSTFFLLLSLVIFGAIEGPRTVLAKEQSDKQQEKQVEKPLPVLYVQNKSMVTGDTFILRVRNMSETSTKSFSSSDSAVASVSDKGTITAMAPGTATITVEIKDEVETALLFGLTQMKPVTVCTLECKIEVGPPAVSVKFSDESIELAGIGAKTDLSFKTIVKPKTTTEKAVYYSSDEKVATINSNGKVVARGIGEAIITAEIRSGEKATIKVVVTEAKTEESGEKEAPVSTGVAITVPADLELLSQNTVK